MIHTVPISRDDEAGRRAALTTILQRAGVLTVQEAWNAGYLLGFYIGGDAPMVKDDLNAIGRRHKGFVRYLHDDPRRESAKKWADYWTPRS